MEANEAALTYLSQNKLLYLNMLEVLRRGSAELLYAGEDGVLLYDRGAEAHMLSARDRAALERFLPLLEGSGAVVGHEMWYRDELTERLGLWQEAPCYQAAWLGDAPPELPPFDGELRPLGGGQGPGPGAGPGPEGKAGGAQSQTDSTSRERMAPVEASISKSYSMWL